MVPKFLGKYKRMKRPKAENFQRTTLMKLLEAILKIDNYGTVFLSHASFTKQSILCDCVEN